MATLMMVSRSWMIPIVCLLAGPPLNICPSGRSKIFFSFYLTRSWVADMYCTGSLDFNNVSLDFNEPAGIAVQNFAPWAGGFNNFHPPLPSFSDDLAGFHDFMDGVAPMSEPQQDPLFDPHASDHIFNSFLSRFPPINDGV